MNTTQYKIRSDILYSDISDPFPVFNIYYICNIPRRTSADNIAKLMANLNHINWDDDVYDQTNVTTHS